jgi:hypothetical protein
VEVKHYDKNRNLTRFEIDGVPQPLSGLGTKIERVAKPIARVIDKVAWTKIAGCKGCRKMKDRLNEGMSFHEALLMRIAERGMRNKKTP